ncbi:dihydrolipoyl dehydrogenase [Candidatus Bathyarchaeota archaeon]|jgi:dihydrolipoamide dehydrogenase|nr:dihydrolipoyl dehydrogenase [Candidatus Bathyarchaeota archaeon]
METFDVLVVGSGSGATIADAAVQTGRRVALVERDAFGGTCLNRGCIPSKMVIYAADLVCQIKQAERLGVRARIEEVDFGFIMERMRRSIAEDRRPLEEAVRRTESLTYYNTTGEFVSDYTMRVGDETVKAENIFIVSGARPLIPPIKGLEGVNYLTSANVWDLRELPKSMIIAGGGFIAAEMAHFFSAMGVDVTIISRSPRLLKNAEPEVSDTLTQALRSRMSVQTGLEVTEVREKGGFKEVTTTDKAGTTQTFMVESLFIAAGLRSNADLLKPERTGVQLDEKGYIKVNEFYETSKPRIWAFGDAIGRAMFKHVANKEAELVWHAFSHGHKEALNYDQIPYAIFTWPQIASVGLTEEEALRRGKRILIGLSNYADTAKGEAMGEEDGFVKVVVEDETYKVLGAHIVGPEAPTLIQEVIDVMNAGDGSVYPILDAMHIHPALPEVVQNAFHNLRRLDQGRRTSETV